MIRGRSLLRITRSRGRWQAPYPVRHRRAAGTTARETGKDRMFEGGKGRAARWSGNPRHSLELRLQVVV
jgi:hypothetical protein